MFVRTATIITGGGTGGHVYPALSIIQYLGKAAPGASARSTAPSRRAGPERTLTRSDGGPTGQSEGSAPPSRGKNTLAYIGNSRGMEATLVPRTGIDCYLFPMASPSSALGVWLLLLAAVRALAVYLRLQPRVTFATGGYVSVPVAVASWLSRTPFVLFLPDVVPGKAVAWLAPLARCIAVATDTAVPYLPEAKTIVTGYPVRDDFRRMTRADGRRRFGLGAERPVLVVFGGSQGSRSINEALASCLSSVLTRCDVIHVCGPKRWEEAQAAAAGLEADRRNNYHLFPYLHDDEMAAAMAAADLALCRSGASTLGELPAAGLPAVLVPLPEAAVHQRENADYLAQHGAAVILDDDHLYSDLEPLLCDLIEDSSRLAQMAESARSLDRPEAAASIAALIEREAA